MLWSCGGECCCCCWPLARRLKQLHSLDRAEVEREEDDEVVAPPPPAIPKLKLPRAAPPAELEHVLLSEGFSVTHE